MLVFLPEVDDGDNEKGIKALMNGSSLQPICSSPSELNSLEMEKLGYQGFVYSLCFPGD